MSAAISITARKLGLTKVLDYGGGNGKTASMLHKYGIEAKSFDPYGLQEDIQHFTPNIVSMIEVIEHTNDPLALFRDLTEPPPLKWSAPIVRKAED